jgi:hypothetical protein
LIELEHCLAELRPTEACPVHNPGLGEISGTISLLVGRAVTSIAARGLRAMQAVRILENDYDSGRLPYAIADA